MFAAAAFAALMLVVVPAVVAAPPAEPTVAVLYFDYEGKSDELSTLRKGLAQMLVSDLAGGAGYVVVERDRLQALLDELKLGGTARMDAESANRVGRLLGARFLVLGGYFDVAGSLRVDARVVEVETGKVVKSVGATGKPDEFLAIEQKIAGELRGILAGKLPPRKDAPPPKRPARPKPPSRLPVGTASKYAAALDAKDRGDTAAAKAGLEAVLKEQPDFALAALDLGSLVK